MDKSTRVLPFDFPSAAGIKQQHSQEPLPVKALWLAIVFPKLALELYSRIDLSQSVVVVEQLNGRGVVYMASAAAEQKGVFAGMSLSAAYALAEELQTVRYSPVRLKKKLQQLANWACRFTSKINVQFPHALLLEVQGSLRLYGGVEALQAQICDELKRDWGYSFHTAITPTPIASLLLAISTEYTLIQHLEPLRSALGKVPVKVLPISVRKKKQLHNVGARVLRDLWRLPKDALARRFGRELVLYLDQALGYATDMREDFRPPDIFETRYDLAFELNDSRRLLQVAEKLLIRLEDYLWRRDLLLYQCVFNFHHHKLKNTRIPIHLRYPGRDNAHLLSLLETRITQVELQAAVVAVSLSAKHFLAYEAKSYELFDLEANSGFRSNENVEKLLQQLQVRLGPKSVQALYAVQDHRPEYAVQYSATLQTASAEGPVQSRPLWLLPVPEALSVVKGRLWYRGPLSFVSGPERIESGWWSSLDVRRDYYIAEDQYHRLLWVYRELVADRNWYLQGLFA